MEKPAPKRGRGKASKALAAAATQPDTGDAAAALAPSTEPEVLFADEAEEDTKEVPQSSSVDKVFSRRGRADPRQLPRLRKPPRAPRKLPRKLTLPWSWRQRRSKQGLLQGPEGRRQTLLLSMMMWARQLQGRHKSLTQKELSPRGKQRH